MPVKGHSLSGWNQEPGSIPSEELSLILALPAKHRILMGFSILREKNAVERHGFPVFLRT